MVDSVQVGEPLVSAVNEAGIEPLLMEKQGQINLKGRGESLLPKER